MYKFFIFLCLGLTYGQIETKNGKLTFKPPELTEEDQDSPHMPEHLKCDGCLAISFQINKALTKKHEGRSENYRLSESQLADVLDDVCDISTYENNYGLTSRKKRIRIKGPGVDDEPGISSMGGRTPGRLSILCTQFLGGDSEIEEKIYEYWLKKQTTKSVRKIICRNPKLKLYSYCYVPPKNKKNNNKKKEDETKDEL